MKYIKTFESHFDVSMIEEIKDYFQEVVDEFSLEIIPMELEVDEYTPGIFYDFHKISDSIFKIYIWVGENFVEKFLSMKNSLNEFYSRIDQIGLTVKTEDFNEYIDYVSSGNNDDSFEISISLK